MSIATSQMSRHERVMRALLFRWLPLIIVLIAVFDAVDYFMAPSAVVACAFHRRLPPFDHQPSAYRVSEPQIGPWDRAYYYVYVKDANTPPGFYGGAQLLIHFDWLGGWAYSGGGYFSAEPPPTSPPQPSEQVCLW